MNCDLCGKETEMFKAIIEGSELTVCKNCGEYGKIVGRVTPASKPKQKSFSSEIQEETTESLAENFGELLKKKREQLGLNQKDFASKIAEKESILHKLETGTMTPTLEKARKLEKMLGLKLIEEVREEPIEKSKDNSIITLGDMVKIKKKGK
jgi:putative transcription factor